MSSSTPAPAVRKRMLTEAFFLAQTAIASTPIRAAIEKLIKASGAGLPVGAGPALTLFTLPGLLLNQRRDQQSTYSQDNVSTAPDGTYYTVVLEFQGMIPDPDRNGMSIPSTSHAIVRKHAPSGTVLQTFDMNTLSGNPFGVQGDDSHNTWVVAVDHNGNVLIAGNTRGTTLRMARTTTPGDLSTFTFVANPLPSAYDSLSYPSFLRKGNGHVAFAAGQGFAAGGRNWFWTEWDGAAFGNVQVLLDGISSGAGAYLQRFAVRGTQIDLWFTYRIGVDADKNRNLYFARSLDNGATFKTRLGAPQSMPITPSNGDIVVPFENGSGMINQGGADIEPVTPSLGFGLGHAAIQLYDAAGKTQIRHVWIDAAGAVHNDQVTNLTARVETVGQNVISELSVARPQLLCTNDGRTLILARMTYDGLGGRPVAIDVTPGASTTPFRLADLDLAGTELVYDQRAVREHNKLRMLITSTDHAKSSKQGWVAQWGGILTIDLARLGEVASGATRLPTIRTVASYSIPTEIPVVANTSVDTAIPELGYAVIPASELLPGVPYFVQVAGTFDLNGASQTSGAFIALRDAASGADVCRLNLVQQSVAGLKASTPWEPVPFTLQPGSANVRSALQLSAHGFSQAGVTGARVRGYRVSIGALDWT